MKINILCIGDIVGKPGRRVLADKLHEFVKLREIDCVIANAENAAGGSGLTKQSYEKLLKYGVNLITLGDHTYRKREIIETLEKADNIVRPANLSSSAAGKDWAIFKTSKGPVIGVAALIGRIFMKPADCPYVAVDKVLGQLQNKADVIVVDMHAEATSEKIAMGYYLDGKVAALFGTHTHVITADERILPAGTAYITDVGMTGPHEGVLGRKSENVIKSFRTQMPFPFEVATGDIRMNGVLVTVETSTKKSQSIERVCIKLEGSEQGYDADDGRPEPLSGF